VELEEPFFERELHVGRGEARTVVPGNAVTQTEAIDRAGLLHRPSLGEIGHRVAALIATEQPVVEELRSRVGGAARGDGGIQMAGIGGDGDDERAAARGDFLGASRGRDRQCEEESNQNDPVVASRHLHPPVTGSNDETNFEKPKYHDMRRPCNDGPDSRSSAGR
jgi:hypothetical protein